MCLLGFNQLDPHGSRKVAGVVEGSVSLGLLVADFGDSGVYHIKKYTPAIRLADESGGPNPDLVHIHNVLIYKQELVLAKP